MPECVYVLIDSEKSFPNFSTYCSILSCRYSALFPTAPRISTFTKTALYFPSLNSVLYSTLTAFRLISISESSFSFAARTVVRKRLFILSLASCTCRRRCRSSTIFCCFTSSSLPISVIVSLSFSSLIGFSR